MAAGLEAKRRGVGEFGDAASPEKHLGERAFDRSGHRPQAAGGSRRGGSLRHRRRQLVASAGSGGRAFRGLLRSSTLHRAIRQAQEPARLGDNLRERAQPSRLADDVEEVAMLAALCVGPLAYRAFAARFEPHEERAARRVADVADAPVAALPPPVRQIMPAHRFGVAGEVVDQIGDLGCSE